MFKKLSVVSIAVTNSLLRGSSTYLKFDDLRYEEALRKFRNWFTKCRKFRNQFAANVGFKRAAS